MASTARGSVTPVTEIVVDGTGAAAVTGAVAVVAEGVERGLHLGAQLYASVEGKVVADLGIGHARAGVPMTPDSMVVWFSMTKPSVAVAVAQQWERGALELDDRVAEHLPEFATHGKDEITIRHLLTHTAGIRAGDAVTSTAPGTAYWDEVVAGISAIEREPDWVPGRRAGYHLSCGMTLLAEIVRRMRRAPLRAVRARRGLRAARHGRLLGGHARRPGRDRTATASAPCTTPRRAPRGRSTTSTRPTSSGCASPAAVGAARSASWRASTRPCSGAARSRVNVSSRRRRSRRSPRGTASVSTTRPSTRSATGASGSRSTPSPWAVTRRRARSATAARSRPSPSPIPSTVSSWCVQTNGMCGNDDHYLRLDAVTTALYEDLGLAPTGAPGRDKPFPSVELTVATTEE